MEDVMSNMGGVSAFTSSEDLLQEELEEWEPGETPPSPPPSTPPPPDPHLHQKVEPLRMAVLTNVNPQQTLTDSDDDLQNSPPPNLHGKVRGLLSGMKKVVMRVKSPQGVQGGRSLTGGVVKMSVGARIERGAALTEFEVSSFELFR